MHLPPVLSLFLCLLPVLPYLSFHCNTPETAIHDLLSAAVNGAIDAPVLPPGAGDPTVLLPPNNHTDPFKEVQAAAARGPGETISPGTGPLVNSCHEEVVAAKANH
ncbi:hypothetical protein BDK51DRAFT_33399 [Blyttiomyces helicus]|uniref:Uncharacterized protein n=1 Tax=Blyttiomyces helicus TaxID=388810 RepID=A0A4P9VWK3_9FUNG|nr:hypothetical protein BDK51DRAFT_33399 [Blyttiomyces helicus]|eukprot:RKO83552.1 hypothetical protein BDK51DRAFT_33399 [Blyttiomyces helicus]